jgi:hypothetical protein
MASKPVTDVPRAVFESGREDNAAPGPECKVRTKLVQLNIGRRVRAEARLRAV